MKGRDETSLKVWINLQNLYLIEAKTVDYLIYTIGCKILVSFLIQFAVDQCLFLTVQMSAIH